MFFVVYMTAFFLLMFLGVLMTIVIKRMIEFRLKTKTIRWWWWCWWGGLGWIGNGGNKADSLRRFVCMCLRKRESVHVCVCVS